MIIQLICYDIDLSTKPYKTMQFHEKAITNINFHQEYPLMASSSNDGTVHIFHFKNNTEIMQDAVMLPLKVLRGHSIKSLEGVKNIIFHPSQPWIFSTGADGKVLLWTWFFIVIPQYYFFITF
jgi:ribosome biogenesis protein ERB1